MLSGAEMTDDPVIAVTRNFYKVELWTRGDQIERMLFAGTSLDKAARYLPTTPGVARSAADDTAAVARARPVAEG
jgi:hypothetical protein